MSHRGHRGLGPQEDTGEPSGVGLCGRHHPSLTWPCVASTKLRGQLADSQCPNVLWRKLWVPLSAP